MHLNYDSWIPGWPHFDDEPGEMEAAENKRWGLCWLAAGLLTLSTILFLSGSPPFFRENLLGVVFAYWIGSALVAGLGSSSVFRGLAQLGAGSSALVVVGLVCVYSDLSPHSAVTVWLGAVAGAANLSSGQRLTPLVIIGQLMPILGMAWHTVARQHYEVEWAAFSVFVACLLALLGSLSSRWLSGPNRRQP